MKKQIKHTPGPWEMKWLRDPGINARGKHIEIMHRLYNEDGEYAGQPGGWQIVVGNKNCERGYILEDADARLITAAPELLTQLKAADELLSTFEQTKVIQHHRKQYQHAIAKAENPQN